MKKIKITLVKSPIDRPERQKQTLKALGLNKTNSSKEVECYSADTRYGSKSESPGESGRSKLNSNAKVIS